MTSERSPVEVILNSARQTGTEPHPEPRKNTAPLVAPAIARA